MSGKGSINPAKAIRRVYRLGGASGRQVTKPGKLGKVSSKRVGKMGRRKS